MAKNLHALLDQAAQLRSCGASWESVGRKVSRRASTCRSWPQRYAAQWNEHYRKAAEARSAELGNEAESRLRLLLHDEDKRWQVKSAEVLLRHRWRPVPIVGPAPAAGDVPQPEPVEEVNPIWVHEWLHCTVRLVQRLARRSRSGAGHDHPGMAGRIARILHLRATLQ